MKRYRNDSFLNSMGVTTPNTTLWTVQAEVPKQYVLAMDYVPKAQEIECAYDYVDEVKKQCNCKPYSRVCFGKLMESLYDYGIEDIFEENVHFAADGKFYLIDLAAQ